MISRRVFHGKVLPMSSKTEVIWGTTTINNTPITTEPRTIMMMG